MEFKLADVAQALGLSMESDARVTGWSIDSRSIAPGDLFFALRGPNNDGNVYVDEVLWKGAVAAIANEVKTGPVLVVPDTLAALQSTAVWALERWGGDVIGVTGSAGKTSTKDVIAALLSEAMPVGKTIGNLNNHFGVPLSILRLPGEARVAVLEMAMNHAGEIRALCAIAKPRIGVVTNVGHAHVEFFDSIDGVAAAKRELIESLPPDGIAVLNADDPLVRRFRDVHPGRSITFGLGPGADFRAENVALSDRGASF
jgi:UDP-N-acetylmuramoyl-tripeptide--D-alanyl-D-alanine ligase